MLAACTFSETAPTVNCGKFVTVHFIYNGMACASLSVTIPFLNIDSTKLQEPSKYDDWRQLNLPVDLVSSYNCTTLYFHENNMTILG